ncbi:saccharopine dehydrogenase NADP-binding domain-containing protein [Acidovorax sp. LjRoot129]|uniref:NAD(P)H-binding protein n=1 Tax=Acidovorax sp. LjRoot129 TaxID=3342260 RepID=UPI003ECFDBA2
MNTAPRSTAIAVYGAAGHTGQFVVQEALRRGLPVVAVGRSAARLAEVTPAHVPQRVADLSDPAALAEAFAGCAVVIHCAGPFLDTAAPVAQAALRAGCHYIDVTAEQASAQATLASLNGISTMAWLPSGASNPQSGTVADGTSGARRPWVTTCRGTVLRSPVLRVPAVGHQRSSAIATVISSMVPADASALANTSWWCALRRTAPTALRACAGKTSTRSPPPSWSRSPSG